MTTLAVLQLRQHRIGHVHIVTVPRTVGDTEGMHIGVLTEILQFVLLVVGVDGYQYGSDLRCGIEERQPIGHVRGPDTDIRPFLHANSNQALGKVIDTLVELTPGKTEITITVDDIFFIRGCLSPVFEPLTECTLRELIACTTSLGRVCSVWQRSACHI